MNIHFIGIGGYGMSALAKICLEKGYFVTGSDIKASELTEKLSQAGAKVFIGHNAENVEGADCVVYSTALRPDNVEWVATQKLGLPLLHRSDLLAKILNQATGVAVAGTHGKTTTSSMISYLLHCCRLSPTFIIGGEVMNFGTNAQAGDSDIVVAEADESDGSFLKYFPSIAVVTNIEADHLENYDGDYEALRRAYMQFLDQVKPNGKIILCLDDPVLKELHPTLERPVVTYGFTPEADYHAVIHQDGFSVYQKSVCLGEITLYVPGRHNVLNAMATLLTGLSLGISFADMQPWFATFQGAKRRFQMLENKKDILIVDDYAHHPTEIQATLQAASTKNKPIIAIFQPQRYTRTYFLLKEFSLAFARADEVIITSIFSPAGEVPIEGVSGERLAELIRENSNLNTKYMESQDEIFDYLISKLSTPSLILTMGAGDIWKLSHRLHDFLKNEV